MPAFVEWVPDGSLANTFHILAEALPLSSIAK
jgi:hypothetical protein